MKFNFFNFSSIKSRDGVPMVRFSVSKVDKDGDLEYTIHGCLFNNQRRFSTPCLMGNKLTPLVELNPLIAKEIEAYLLERKDIDEYLGPKRIYEHKGGKVGKIVKMTKEERKEKMRLGSFTPGEFKADVE